MGKTKKGEGEERGGGGGRKKKEKGHVQLLIATARDPRNS